MVGNKRNTFWEIRFLPWKFGWDKVLERPRSFSVHCSSLPLNWVFGWRVWSQNFMPSSQPWFRGTSEYVSIKHECTKACQLTNTPQTQYIQGATWKANRFYLQMLWMNIVINYTHILACSEAKSSKMLPSEGGMLTNYAEMFLEVTIVGREALCKHLWVDQALW